MEPAVGALGALPVDADEPRGVAGLLLSRVAGGQPQSGGDLVAEAFRYELLAGELGEQVGG